MNAAQAVASLRSGAGFVMRGDKASGIEWITENVDPITQAELEAEMLRLEQAAVEAQAADAADRESAMSKLSALGLNDAEINAIIGGI